MITTRVSTVCTTASLIGSTLALSSLATAAEVSGASEGAAQPATALEEIIVTAQKREERLQDVPLAVTGFDEGDLQRMGIVGVNDLNQFVPSVSVEPYPQESSTSTVFIRGVGTVDSQQIGADSGVGIYVDDVYLGRAQGLISDLGDIERVEVLRGPQGTLYGRNTIGGAIKFVMAKPTGEFDFSENLDVGNFGYIRSLTNVNLPAWAGISSKLSYLRNDLDGWVDNAGTAGDFGQKRQEGVRVALSWRPQSLPLTIDYAYDHGDQEGTPLYAQPGPVGRTPFPFASPVFTDRLDESWRPVDYPMRDDFTQEGHAVTVDWRLQAHTSLKWIASYRTIDTDSAQDSAEAFGLPAAYTSETSQHQNSNELLLSGDSASEDLQYVIGLYWFEESAHQVGNALINPFGLVVDPTNTYYAYRPPTLADLAPSPLGISSTDNRSMAGYGQISWTLPILDRRMTVDLGARYTRDEREIQSTVFFNPLPHAEKSYSSVDPSATVDVRFSEHVHGYVKYAEAYKAGGFNSRDNAVSPYDPEKLRAWEVGVKAMAWQDRLQLNVAAYDSQYDDVQFGFLNPADFTIHTVNAGERSLKGVETDFQLLPWTGLTWRLSHAYLDAKQIGEVINPFNGLPLQDTAVPLAPRNKLTTSLEYAFSAGRIGTLSAWVSYSYNDEQNSNGGPGTGQIMRPSFSVVDARLTLSDARIGDGNLQVSLWARNLADEEYVLYRYFGEDIYGQPRSYGVNVLYRYGR